MVNIVALRKREIADILEDFPGWDYSANKITKKFKFADFSQAIDFLWNIKYKFDAIDHHPDIHVTYDTVRFDLQRYDVGAVTDRDFEAARIIDLAFESLP